MKKKDRIKKESEFRKIIQKKDSYANRNLIVYINEKEGKHYRVGLSVGKKVGNAVQRNRVKRLLRQSLMNLSPKISDHYEFILIARPAICQLSLVEYEKNLTHVLTLAGVIKKQDEEK